MFLADQLRLGYNNRGKEKKEEKKKNNFMLAEALLETESVSAWGFEGLLLGEEHFCCLQCWIQRWVWESSYVAE